MLCGVALAAYTLAVAAAAVALLELARPALAPAGADERLDSARALLLAPWNYARALVSPPPTEEFQIDVQFKHLHRIHEKRAEALRRGVLFASDDDLVPATITHAGRVVPVELRLTGDVESGLEGSKWPLQVETERDAYLLGMRQFTLLDPSASGRREERLPFAQLRALEIVAPRSALVKVVLNGKQLGVMLLKEQYAKEMLESQQRREGVILRYDDEAFLESSARTGDHGPFDNPHIARLSAIGEGRIRRSETLSEQRTIAVGLLNAYFAGELPAEAVFDLPVMGAYLAAAELWQSPSALRWDQLRFYLNPLTSRIEPVGSSFTPALEHARPGLVGSDSPLASQLLADPELRAAFVAAAHRIADDVLEGDLVARTRALDDEDLRHLHAERPWLRPFDFDPLRRRARMLRALDTTAVASFGAALGAGSGVASPLRASLREVEAGLVLELVNALPVALEVVELGWRRGDDPLQDLTAELGRALPIALAPTPLDALPTPLELALPSRPGKRPRVEGMARIVGESAAFPFRAGKADPLVTRNPVHHPSLAEVLAAHDFLKFDATTGRLVAAAGRFSVEGSLVLPDGVGLLLPAGAELRFAAGEGLIARGPLEFAGTAEQPVVLTGPVGNEASDLWAGVAVLGTDATSRWTHVHVHHTGGFARTGWRLTGGIVFRRAPVEMQSCRILDNRAEDALNIVRARFSLQDVEIKDAASDAIDTDFSNGSISGGVIRNAGGDGIDVSGSDVEVRGVTLQGLGDKAISVGEASRLRASDLTIQSVGTAFVSKDRSYGELRDSSIRNVRHVALMAYVKKPEYGPAELVAEGNHVEDVGTLGLAQTGSRVSIDGTDLPEQDVDIGQLYREGYMQK